MKEIWKDVVGYEGLYRISNYCKIYSYYANRNLSITLGKRGYYVVCLNKNGKRKTLTIHRLMGIHFIDNPKSKPCINHIDGNKLNNKVDNLEWCTYSENQKHAFKTGLNKPQRAFKGKFGKLHHSSKKVYQYTICGFGLNVFYSTHEAERITGIKQSNISSCALGKVKTAGGYLWKYN